MNVLDSIQHKAVIFDWDDTLLSSSHLARLGHRLDTSHPFDERLKQGLQKLEDVVNQLLDKAFHQVGPRNVIVITNAEEGWVQLSARKFIPRVIPNIQRCKIISARSTFEGLHPGNPCLWKTCAMHSKLQECFGISLPDPCSTHKSKETRPPFANRALQTQKLSSRADMVTSFFPSKTPLPSAMYSQYCEYDKENFRYSAKPEVLRNISGSVTSSSSSSLMSSRSSSTSPTKCVVVRHVVSFGDSLVEQQAALSVGKLIDRCVVKCVKLMERPSLEDLVRQLLAVSNGFQTVLNYPRPLSCATIHARNLPLYQQPTRIFALPQQNVPSDKAPSA